MDDAHTTSDEAGDEDSLLDPPTIDRPSRASPRIRSDTLLDPGVGSELRPGSVVAEDFVISQRVLRGELGTLYEAVERSTGRPRTLKVLGRASERGPAARDVFFREARVTARVQSPHAVDVIASGEDEAADVLWIAFEQLTGETLAARLALLGVGVPMEPPAASELLEQLFRGLTAAHDEGVVHGDLKPANVFLAPGMPFTVKLLDFSVASAEGERDVPGVMGTPLWMAPEQASGGAVTPATDVWSAGLLAFRLLTGRHYWLTARTSVVETRQCFEELTEGPLAGAAERAEAIGVTRPLPEGFDAWFERCVARDPRRRFRSADEMSFAWREVRCDPAPARPRLPTQPAMPIATAQAPQTFPPSDPISFHHASEAPTRSIPRRPRPPRRALVITAVAAAACATTVAAVALHRREARDAPDRTSTPLTLVAAPAAGPWRERAAWQWAGVAAGDDGEWRFALTLRRAEGARVRGSFAWTAVRAFTAEPGAQVRETVEGTYDPAAGAFELRGVMSTDPASLPVNRWRVTLRDDGAVSGATPDGLATLTGAPRR